MGILDKLLGFGASFDWITPVFAEIQDAANSPNRTFLIPRNCGKSGREIEQALKQRGIKTWGTMIVKGTIMITVCAKDANNASWLLSRAQVPFR